MGYGKIRELFHRVAHSMAQIQFLPLTDIKFIALHEITLDGHAKLDNALYIRSWRL